MYVLLNTISFGKYNFVVIYAMIFGIFVKFDCMWLFLGCRGRPGTSRSSGGQREKGNGFNEKVFLIFIELIVETFV